MPNTVGSLVEAIACLAVIQCEIEVPKDFCEDQPEFGVGEVAADAVPGTCVAKRGKASVCIVRL